MIGCCMMGCPSKSESKEIQQLSPIIFLGLMLVVTPLSTVGFVTACVLAAMLVVSLCDDPGMTVVTKIEESEIERIVPSAVNTGSETGTLVEVKLQKKTKQTQKYLEAEPKALGVTQIMLSLFILSAMKLNWNYHHFHTTAIIAASLSSVNIIAGSVAIAAQNLHLPTVMYDHITGLQMLMHLTQIALSATLAAFCCKVIQCCSPTTSMTVVVVNAPPAPQ